MKKLIGTSLLILSIAPVTVLAGPEAGAKEFSISGSGSSDKDFNNNLFNLDATFGSYFSKQSEFGIRQSVGVSDTENDSSRWNGATRLFYDYHFDLNRWRPFLGANIGYIYGDGVEESFIAGPELGVKYYVLDTTFISGTVEYQFLFDSATDADSQFDDGAYAYGVGMGFNF